MNAQAIKLVMGLLVLLLLAGYAWFIWWRVKVDRQKKEAEAERATSVATPSASSALGRPRSAPSFDRVGDATLPASPPTADAAATVLDAVTGISLPCDLVPHPDAAARPGSHDRVALITSSAPADAVRDGLATALSEVGYDVRWDGDEGLASRPGTELRVSLYDAPATAELGGRPAFPYAPAGSIVVDLWLPET